MQCCDCELGEAERAVGNGVNESAYIWLIHCPFDKAYYKRPETNCEFEEMRLAAERSKPMGMVVDNVEITNVNVPDLSKDEIRRYIQAVDKPARAITIVRTPDGKIQLDYELDNPKFERIRRITGYLVGTIDRWNNAKKSEERERVKHDVS